MATGEAFYFDGSNSTRHAVTVESDAVRLRIAGKDGTPIADWPYSELRSMSSPDSVLRLSRAGGPELARLELRDPALIADVLAHADRLNRAGATERRLRTRVALWSIAATVSLVLVAVYGVPALSDRLAPLIPLSVEQRFGDAVNVQVRSMLDTGQDSKPFECGIADAEKAGRAALEALIVRLEQAAALPIPLRVNVVRRREANAVALPGGHIYVFDGLIRGARNPDELAGVIAHEIGHIAHRDGTRSLLEAAGLSFLFGMLLGDFTGGGLVVMAARTVVQSGYSRDVESAADIYGVGLMANAGGDPRALGVILERIAGAIEPGSKILRDHPETRERVAAINATAAALASTSRPLLTPSQWTALKTVCG